MNDEAKPGLVVSQVDELLASSQEVVQAPSGLVFRIRKVNSFMLARLPLPERAVEIARKTGDEAKAEAIMTSAETALLIQQLVHVGVVEPALSMPGRPLVLDNEGPREPSVDDLDTPDLLFLYRAICKLGGLEALNARPFPEHAAGGDSGPDGAAVAGGRDAPGLPRAAAGEVDDAAADPSGGAGS